MLTAVGKITLGVLIKQGRLKRGNLHPGYDAGKKRPVLKLGICVIEKQGWLSSANGNPFNSTTKFFAWPSQKLL
jgi:hypothetical protein